MRFSVLVFVFILLPSLVFTQNATKSTSSGNGGWRTYGDAMSVTKQTPLSKALADKKLSSKKDIMIEGTISEVCQNKGCWMVVNSGKDHVRVEFKDYGFFVPWDSEGKRVRLQGRIEQKNVGKKAAEHMAGEMKNPPVKSDDIKDEQTITVFTASSVAIEGGSEIGAEQQDILDGKKKKEGHQDEEHDHDGHGH